MVRSEYTLKTLHMWQVKTNPETVLFLDNLEIPSRNKIRYAVSLLKEYGHLIRAPHSKKISVHPSLFELRSSGNSPVRVFYSFHNGVFYLLHGYIKKSNKTPKKEISIAINRHKVLTFE